MTPSAPLPFFAPGRFPARGFARLLGALGALAVTTAGAEPAAATGPEPTGSRAIPDLALTLLWVKPGAFTMGSPPDEPNRHKAEGPPRRVTLTTGFWLGKTEVTQSQYEAVDGANPSRFTDVGKNAPVESVSWLDAMA